MMARPLVLQQMEWLNVRVGNTLPSLDVREVDIYALVDIFFMSYLTNLSKGATRSLFMEVGSHQPTEYMCDMLTSRLCRFHPSFRNGQNVEGRFSWDCRHDQTRCLTDFERNLYAIGKRRFYVPT